MKLKCFQHLSTQTPKSPLGNSPSRRLPSKKIQLPIKSNKPALQQEKDAITHDKKQKTHQLPRELEVIRCSAKAPVVYPREPEDAGRQHLPREPNSRWVYCLGFTVLGFGFRVGLGFRLFLRRVFLN